MSQSTPPKEHENNTDTNLLHTTLNDRRTALFDDMPKPDDDFDNLTPSLDSLQMKYNSMQLWINIYKATAQTEQLLFLMIGITAIIGFLLPPESKKSEQKLFNEALIYARGCLTNIKEKIQTKLKILGIPSMDVPKLPSTLISYDKTKISDCFKALGSVHTRLQHATDMIQEGIQCQTDTISFNCAINQLQVITYNLRTQLEEFGRENSKEFNVFGHIEWNTEPVKQL